MTTELHFDLRKLDHFLSIVAHGSINRAAMASNISQAGLTKSIRSLESQIDGQLFERGPQGVKLTRLGETFLRHARLIDNQRSRAEAAVLAQNSGTAVELTIGVSMRWALRLVMPSVLAKFATDVRRPKITIKSGRQSWQMIEALRDGELDVVLATPTETDDLTGIAAQYFHKDPQRLVVRKGHPLAEKKKLSLAELEAYDWIRGPPETYFGRFLEGLYLTEGRVPPEPLLVIDSNALALDIVAQSDLIGVATKRMVSVDHSETVIMLNTRGRLERTTAILTRAGDVLPDTATDVIAVIGQALNQETEY